VEPTGRGLKGVSELSQILNEAAQGDPVASSTLLPLVYHELRRLAAQKLAHEVPGQTFTPTALVHEAYVRLVGTGDAPRWENRRHFFAAAAETMRRILVENARRKKTRKRGGDLERRELAEDDLAVPEPREDLLALDEALNKLAAIDREAANLVELRFFAGLTLEQAAEALDISPRSADRLWAYARAWLHREIQDNRAV
jgi:RNA polymerase sigma factor (TIGR02999 family)